VIESRADRDDGRDRQTLIEVLRDTDTPLRYRWEDKSEPSWDSRRCLCVVKEYPLAEDISSFKRLQAASVIEDLRYRRVPPRNA